MLFSIYKNHIFKNILQSKVNRIFKNSYSIDAIKNYVLHHLNQNHIQFYNFEENKFISRSKTCLEINKIFKKKLISINSKRFMNYDKNIKYMNNVLKKHLQNHFRITQLKKIFINAPKAITKIS